MANQIEKNRLQEAIGCFDSIFKSGVAAGWKPYTYRMGPKDDGFQIEEQVILMNGKIGWQQVTWSRNRKDVENRYVKLSK